MLVVFRTDSSDLIGAGHLMRCRALAEELSGHGARVVFVCRDLPGNSINLLDTDGLETFTIGTAPLCAAPKYRINDDNGEHSVNVDQTRDADETLSVLSDMAPDWLIVDHYLLDSTWEKRLRDRVGKIMVIDDIADRVHDCDLLLDQNIRGDSKEVYSTLIPHKSEIMLGPRFALLRPEFHEFRRIIPPRMGDMKRILISFGSVDRSGETMKALHAVRMFDREDVLADVVVGLPNPCSAKIESVCKSSPKLRLHFPANCMAELMAGADLSIGAGGVTSWERCCLGLPAIVKPVAANQVSLTTNLAESGAIELIPFTAKTGPEEYLAALDRMDSERLRKMAHTGMELVDGLGCGRVAQCLLDF